MADERVPRARTAFTERPDPARLSQCFKRRYWPARDRELNDECGPIVRHRRFLVRRGVGGFRLATKFV